MVVHQTVELSSIHPRDASLCFGVSAQSGDQTWHAAKRSPVAVGWLCGVRVCAARARADGPMHVAAPITKQLRVLLQPHRRLPSSQHATLRAHTAVRRQRRNLESSASAVIVGRSVDWTCCGGERRHIFDRLWLQPEPSLLEIKK